MPHNDLCDSVKNARLRKNYLWYKVDFLHGGAYILK